MNHHHIRIYEEHYNNVRAGTKTFEIRKNDRAYQKGDTVTLYWWHKEARRSDIGAYVNDETPKLTFRVGDVYPIDAETVVFSLLKIEVSNDRRIKTET